MSILGNHKDRFLELAEKAQAKYKSNDAKASNDFWKQAVQLSEKHKDLAYPLFRTCCQFADLKGTYGDFDDAEKILNHAGSLLSAGFAADSDVNEANELAKLNYKHAIIELNRGNYNAAVKTFKLCSPFFNSPEANTTQEAAEFFNFYGRTLERTKKYAEAVEVQVQALKIYQKLPSTPINQNAIQVLKEFVQQIPSYITKASDRQALQRRIEEALSLEASPIVPELKRALEILHGLGIARDLSLALAKTIDPTCDGEAEVDDFVLLDLFESYYSDNRKGKTRRLQDGYGLYEDAFRDDNAHDELKELQEMCGIPFDENQHTTFESMSEVQLAVNNMLKARGDERRFVQLESVEDQKLLLLLNREQFKTLETHSMLVNEADPFDFWEDFESST